MTAPKDLSACTDQQLVDLFILENDELAARELVNRYREDVFAVAQDIVGNFDDADSVGQRTFIKAFDALPQYDPEREFGPWLATIARNAALDRVKQKKRFLPIDQASGTPSPWEPLMAVQVADPGPDPLLLAIVNEKWDQVRGVLETFSPNYREAMLMHLEGAPHAEIAEQLGVSVNTVNSYIHRGRKRLKRALHTDPLTPA